MPSARALCRGIDSHVIEQNVEFVFCAGIVILGRRGLSIVFLRLFQFHKVGEQRRLDLFQALKASKHGCSSMLYADDVGLQPVRKALPKTLRHAPCRQVRGIEAEGIDISRTMGSWRRNAW